MTTQSQWEYISTTPSSLHPSFITDTDANAAAITCKDSTTKLNEKEQLGPRPDLCKQGTGRYPAPDCRYYVQCTGINAAVARCPGGFVFDPVGSQCDWPSKNLQCLQSCYESGNFDKPQNPEPTPSVTPQPFLTTTIDSDIRTANLSCNESHCVPKAGCQVELCKEPRGQFEIIGNCSKFANCWENCAYITDCPDYLVFTDLKGACDLPFNLPQDHRCYTSPYSGGQHTLEASTTAGSSSGSTLPAGAEQDQDNDGGINSNSNNGYTFAPLKFPSFAMNQMQGTGPGRMVQAQW
ncbi:hypothetical protein RvY_00261 [Ramazzottius varieornatus]|uniref:Chitin-binding type-2 domain-containing protein n=1 Tax=Ramazzottius varieornatus TaxID=947166 RepID=A0A1D1UC68_RAMVA|nr:hypothetical protein RvY_00261 [Ramazzottius varieornatus]